MVVLDESLSTASSCMSAFSLQYILFIPFFPQNSLCGAHEGLQWEDADHFQRYDVYIFLLTAGLNFRHSLLY